MIMWKSLRHRDSMQEWCSSSWDVGQIFLEITKVTARAWLLYRSVYTRKICVVNGCQCNKIKIYSIILFIYS